jgi:predicted AAA+ superfamily ATPase
MSTAGRPDDINGRVADGALVPRRAQPLVCEALADTRVVAINGARQAGKSTLARIAAASATNVLVRLLDDPATLRAAYDDPTGFVDHDGLLVIDEAQLAPELFRAIKLAVDTDPRPGRFMLTGSAQVLALRELAAIERRGELRRLLALLAGPSGGLLVPSTLAAQSRVPRSALSRYLEMLSAVFLIKQIPAWSSNRTQRAIGTPKLAGSTVRTEDLAGLRHLADRLGSRLVAGYVLYTGQQTLPFGDRLRALPIDALWHLTP